MPWLADVSVMAVMEIKCSIRHIKPLSLQYDTYEAYPKGQGEIDENAGDPANVS